MAFLSSKMEVNTWDLQMTTTEAKETPNPINFEGINRWINKAHIIGLFIQLFIHSINNCDHLLCVPEFPGGDAKQFQNPWWFLTETSRRIYQHLRPASSGSMIPQDLGKLRETGKCDTKASVVSSPEKFQLLGALMGTPFS